MARKKKRSYRKIKEQPLNPHVACREIAEGLWPYAVKLKRAVRAKNGNKWRHLHYTASRRRYIGNGFNLEHTLQEYGRLSPVTDAMLSHLASQRLSDRAVWNQWKVVLQLCLQIDEANPT
jgi:hypothetical protein